MLGYWGDEEKTKEVEDKWNVRQISIERFSPGGGKRWLDAHWRHCRDNGGRLWQDCRQDEGHGDQGRREHLSKVDLELELLFYFIHDLPERLRNSFTAIQVLQRCKQLEFTTQGLN